MTITGVLLPCPLTGYQRHYYTVTTPDLPGPACGAIGNVVLKAKKQGFCQPISLTKQRFMGPRLVTLPYRWLAPGEYHRSLTVVPLIADQRYYGETPAGLPTYPPDWLVAAGERCGAKGWALTQPNPIRRAYRGVGSRPRARAQARSGTVDLHIGTCLSHSRVMNCQLPVLRGQGEGFGTFTRLRSRIFFRRFPGGELQLPGAGALFFTKLCYLFGFFPYVQVEGRFHIWQSARLQQAHWRPTDVVQVRLRQRSLGGQLPTHDLAPQRERLICK